MWKDEGNSLTSQDDDKAGNRISSTNSQVRHNLAGLVGGHTGNLFNYVYPSQEGQEWKNKI